MTKPMIKIFDMSTQEEVIREMNDEEYSLYLYDIEESKKAQAERETKQKEIEAIRVAVEAKLAALGLDLDTVKAIAKL